MPSVTARSLRFNYSVLGTGAPPIVAIHGLALDNLSSFFFTIGPELARHARLLLFDLRGHGGSEQPDGPYTLDEMARDTDALLDATQFATEPVFVIGHSFGGLIALRFAMMFPERVRGLVLIEGLTGTPEFGERMAATLDAPEEEQAETIKRLFGKWVSLQEAKGRKEDVVSTVKRVDGMQSRRRNHAIENVKSLLKSTSLVRDMAETPTLTPEALSTIRCPVLAVYGESSDVLEEGRRLQAHIPDCRLDLIPNCGHKVLWQGVDQLVPAIAGWMNEVMATGARS